MIIELEKLDYMINMQLVNYNNQVIGLVINEGKSTNKYYLPCLPSNINNITNANNANNANNTNYPYTFVQNFTQYQSYKNTISFLKIILTDVKVCGKKF